MTKPKGSYGTACTIIDIRKERREWLSTGKGNCKRCAWLKWGYYCDKKKRSAEDVGKPNHCEFYKKKKSV